MGSNFVIINPLGKVEGHPEVVEFEFLDLDQVWALGPNTRFVVKGRFEVLFLGCPNLRLMEKCHSGRLAQRKSWTRWWSNPTGLSLCFIEWIFFMEHLFYLMLQKLQVFFLV